MQQFSFDFDDPFFDIAGWQIALQIVTFENTYGLDPGLTGIVEEGGRWLIEAGGLTWAGGQQLCHGSAWLRATPTADGLELTAGAEHTERIRCLKLILRGVQGDALIGRGWESQPLPAKGAVLRYPLLLHAPLIFIQQNDGQHLYFHGLDDRVRAKRFTVYAAGEDSTIELIHEEAAHEMGKGIETPPWRIGRCADPEEIVDQHMTHLKSAFGLQPWEARTDVPDWAREISLVVALHGMHWTGYVFNTYEQMLHALEWVCERIEGKRVLAFLPGWEGRYYWQYGDYRPEPRLGSADGFRELADGARRLGVTLMPMFGANCANANLPGFDKWGAPSLLRSPGGITFTGNRPDWDASRSNDPGWQAWLNPGAPRWREHLLKQASGILAEYGLRAVFFDTQHIWENDPDYPLYEGLVALRAALKERFPDLLIAGEGWYDALGAVTPVSQVGTPSRWEQIFSRYCRTFAHLGSGDPSRDSAGVHEAGYKEFRLVPDAPHWWPTLTVVEDTLERAPKEAERVIKQAREYARRYCPARQTK
jgi:hypothetical protein